jgi:4-amino-4-deoxy-L-arabinose transferase-like glycosyltransferase
VPHAVRHLRLRVRIAVARRPVESTAVPATETLSTPAPRRPARVQADRVIAWLGTPGGLAALFIAGLAIRLILMRGGGFPFDMSSFAAWASTLADKGPWNFYPFDPANEFFVDYPPGYLYVLWIIGLVAKVIGGGAPSVALIKLPGIVADIALAWMIGLLAERLAPATVVRRLPVRAIASAAILLNPAIFFISAVWGQADAVLALLVVGCFFLLATGEQTLRREAGAVALLALAFGTKPQVIFAVPIVALLVVWRHLRPDVLARAPERGTALRVGVRRLAALAAVAVLAGFAMFAPFALHPVRAFDFYVRASRTYKVTSVFAFNLWGAVGFWKPDSGDGADVVRILGVPAVIWGIVAFIALGGLVLARAWRALREGSDEGRVLVFGGVAITLVAFVVVTRVHERYLFLPLALLAVLVGQRWMRRAFVVLSALYMLNIYFPYVYYLRYVKRPAPALGGFFDALYGTDINGMRMKVICVIVGAACLAIAATGWRRFGAFAEEAVDEEPDRATSAVDGPSRPAGLADGTADAEAVIERPKWTLALHPVGRRGALLAVGIFVLAFVMRLAGLGHPPGMYFDEVYHARAGAEYLANKEVFEYTHPPLAKEIIGFAIHHMAGFGARSGGALPSGVAPASIATAKDGLLWAREADAGRTDIQHVTLDAACRVGDARTLATLDVEADAIAASPTSTLVAGTSGDGDGDGDGEGEGEGEGAAALVRLEGSSETWRASLPGRATQLTTVGERAFLITRDGELVDVSPEGEARTLAVGAASLAGGDDTEVVVAFPDDHLLAAYDSTGNRTSTIDTTTGGTAIGTHRPSQRAFLSVGDEIVAYDTERDAEQARVPGAASAIATVPETHVVWAVDGERVRAIEPHSAAVIGTTSFDRVPDRLVADPVEHRLVGVAGSSLECAGGRAQFAWRFGSAVMGALMVAFIFLIALRLFGNTTLAALAALFLAIDGLAFTISRIAMNDSYAMAFALAAWFCALSALHASGRARTDDPDAKPTVSRGAAIVWLFATGLTGGLGLASKWPVIYALGGIGLLYLWDGFDRREHSIWRVAGGFVPSIALIAVAMGALPLAVYFLTYLPYMSLGHSFADALELQRGMFNYHATLTATHPYGSPWYGWPLGYRAVYLYVHTTGAERAEIWTFPNLVVFWGGLLAFAVAVRRFVSQRSVALALVVGPALVQYVPWIFVGRVTFMYHYLPVVPFLALGLAWLLVRGVEDERYRPHALRWAPVAAVAFFLFSYPILVGWTMPNRYFDLTRVFSWVIP